MDIHLRYLIAAVILSPIIGVFVASLVRDLLLLIVMDFDSWLHNVPDFIVSGISITILGLVFSLPVVLLYGLPVFYILKKFKLQTYWMFGLFGLLPSGFGLLTSMPAEDTPAGELYLIRTSLYVFGGLFTAVTFWFISEHLPIRRHIKSEL